MSKKLISFLLVLCLVMSFGSAFAATKPFSNPWDEEMIDASVVVYQRSNQGVADQIWWWDFCREYFKINFTVTQTSDAGNYKTLAFMSGDMPDVFYQFFMSTGHMV